MKTTNQPSKPSKPTFTKVILHKELILPFEVQSLDELFNVLVEDNSFKIERSFDDMIANKELEFKIIQDKA